MPFSLATRSNNTPSIRHATSPHCSIHPDGSSTRPPKRPPQASIAQDPAQHHTRRCSPDDFLTKPASQPLSKPPGPGPRRNRNTAHIVFTRATKPTPKDELQQARREAPDDRSRNCDPTLLYPFNANSAVPPRREKRSTTCKTQGSEDPNVPQATAALDRKSRFPSAACNTSTTKPGTRHSQEALHKAPPAEIRSDPGWPTDNERSPRRGLLLPLGDPTRR